MTGNPILDEIHAVREGLLASAGGTLDALVDRLQEEEQQSNRPRFKTSRTGVCNGAANPGQSTMENPSSPSRD